MKSEASISIWLLAWNALMCYFLDVSHSSSLSGLSVRRHVSALGDSVVEDIRSMETGSLTAAGRCRLSRGEVLFGADSRDGGIHLRIGLC